MILNEKYILPNEVEIPKIGLGTWFISDDTVAQAVKDAVAIGYRHIDTAQRMVMKEAPKISSA